MASGSAPRTSARASFGRKRLVKGAQTPHGAPTSIPANLGVLSFPPFYLLSFPGWFSLTIYICIKLWIGYFPLTNIQPTEGTPISLLRSDHCFQLSRCLFRQIAVHMWHPNSSHTSLCREIYQQCGFLGPALPHAGEWDQSQYARCYVHSASDKFCKELLRFREGRWT